jgi:retinol-binding protein 3
MDFAASSSVLPSWRESIRLLGQNIRSFYVYPDLAEAIEADLLACLNRSTYHAITTSQQLCELLTKQLRALSDDLHFLVVDQEMLARLFQADRGLPSRNFGFEKLERLPGNIGYLDLRCCADPGLAESRVTAAMTLLSSTYALIIDLRHNTGGHPGMNSLLISYLMSPEPVQISSIYWRASATEQPFWTHAQVPGPRYEQKPVYVLTSQETFSAAEAFAYDLQALKRAIIIGERTGRGANPGGWFELGQQLSVFIPTGRAVNPHTGTNWRKHGVIPDIETPGEQALEVAHHSALHSIVDHLQDISPEEGMEYEIDEAWKELE